MTAFEIINGINAYPIPTGTIGGFALNRGVDLDAQATAALVASREYNLLRADVLTWLSYAPNISQGGQTYSFSEEQRTQFRAEAQALYSEFETNKPKAKFGYKGDRL